jgi:hypothetical protein
VWPERLDLGVRQDACATRRRVRLDAAGGIERDDLLIDRPREYRRRRGQRLIRHDRRLDRPDRAPDIGACDLLGTDVPPAREEVPADEIVRLLPRLVSPLRPLLAVAIGQFAEGPGAPIGLALARGVSALGDLIEDAGGELAGAGDSDRGIADVVPARATAVAVDELEDSPARRVDDEAKAALKLIPIEDPAPKVRA